MAARKKRAKPRARKNALYSVDVEPLGKNERIDKRLLKNLKLSKPSGKKHSRVEGLTGVAANIIIPGLGNYYLHKGKLSIALLAVNLLFIIIFLSPIYTLNFAASSLSQSFDLAEGPVITIYSSGPPVALQHPLSAYVYIPLFFIALSWIYLIAQLVHGKKQ